MLLREERADEFSAVRARGVKELGAQIVLLLIGNLRLNRHYFRN